METYLFIDGGYLQERYKSAVERFFGEPGEFDYRKFAAAVGARRTYYYDCLHDVKLASESDLDVQKRVLAQQSFFDELQSLPGFHVRLGSLSGTQRKLRQKKVDILLAVEAMENAFRKNMERVCIVAGDLDFAPLVDSLVRLGTYVEVCYDVSSAARGLYSAADFQRPMDLASYHGWSSERFRARHPIPVRVAGAQPPHGTAGYTLVRVGRLGDDEVQLWVDRQQYYLFFPSFRGGPSLQGNFRDEKQLVRYFEAEYGAIHWAQ